MAFIIQEGQTGWILIATLTQNGFRGFSTIASQLTVCSVNHRTRQIFVPFYHGETLVTVLYGIDCPDEARQIQKSEAYEHERIETDYRWAMLDELDTKRDSVGTITHATIFIRLQYEDFSIRNSIKRLPRKTTHYDRTKQVWVITLTPDTASDILQCLNMMGSEIIGAHEIAKLIAERHSTHAQVIASFATCQDDGIRITFPYNPKITHDLLVRCTERWCVPLSNGGGSWLVRFPESGVPSPQWRKNLTLFLTEHPVFTVDDAVWKILDNAPLENSDQLIPSEGFCVPEIPSLYPYQLAGIESMLRILAIQPTVLNADEPGLGKSIQAIGVVTILDRIGTGLPCVVVCPNSLKWTWVGQFQTWRPTWKIVVAGRHNNQRNAFCKEITPKTPERLHDADVIIVNYDTAHRWLPLIEQLQINPQVLIVDECHYIKTSIANGGKPVRRTHAVLQFQALVPNTIFLSGTPILNHPGELINVLGNCLETTFGGRRAFETRYNDAQATHLTELATRLQGWVVRRRKEQVLPELPPKTFRITVTPEDEQYADTLRDVYAWFGDERNQDASFADVMSQMTILRRAAGRAKISILQQWIRESQHAGEKIVVFVYYQDILRALCAEFPDAARIHPDDNVQERAANVERFQTDPTCLVCLCSVTIAGEGITLTASSRAVIGELGWVPAQTIEQPSDRLARIGQQHHVTIDILIVHKSIDEIIWRTLERKMSMIDMVIGNDAKDIMGVTPQQMVIGAVVAAAREFLKSKGKQLAVRVVE